MGPAGHHVRKIRRPHHAVNANFMPQTHADMIFEKSPVCMLLQILAWAPPQSRQSEVPLSPEAVDLIFMIDLLIEIWQPSGVILGPINLELGKAIEYPRYHQLDRFNGTRVVRPLTRKALHEIGGRPRLSCGHARI